MERVVRQATETPDKQIVGVLLGGQSGDGILVDDATTGPSESNSVHVTLPADSIARIADDIIKRRIRGSIVGWYHSHVRGGVFMSDTDVETQLKLQQFSPMVAAMVIDAQTGKTEFFRADSKTKEAIPVRHETMITAAPMAAPNPQAYYPQAPGSSAPTVSTRTIVVAVLLIMLAITGGIIALAYYRSETSTYGNLAITHNPPKGPFTIARQITLDANVTGSNLQNVTLAYRVIERTSAGAGFIFRDLVAIPMLLKAAEEDIYSYTIPSSEVSGVYLQYYISAFDSASPPNVVRTDVYVLNVGDFDWQEDKTELTIIRTLQTQLQLKLDSINAFNQPVTIKIATSAPLGVRIVAASTQVKPPSPAVLTISSTDNAQITQNSEVEIDAVYAVGAIQIIRTTILSLTVTDFDIDVQPTYQEARRCSNVDTCATYDAFYTVTLTINKDFTAPNGIKVSVTGLPDDTTWELVLTDHKIAGDGTETLAYYLRIHAKPGAKAEKYILEVTGSASTASGTIIHTVNNVQLEIST